MEEQNQTPEVSSNPSVQSIPTESPKKPFPRKILFLILGLVGLVLIVGGGFIFASQQNKTAQISPTPSIEMSPTITSESTAISPTCIPRPSCLDLEPRCLIPETPDMCPPPTTSLYPSTNSVSAICASLNNPSDVRGGMSFQESFCQGDYCLSTNKESCQSQDMVKVEGGQIIKGQDGIVDCSWNPSFNMCGPVK